MLPSRRHHPVAQTPPMPSPMRIPQALCHTSPPHPHQVLGDEREKGKNRGFSARRDGESRAWEQDPTGCSKWCLTAQIPPSTSLSNLSLGGMGILLSPWHCC